MQSEVGEVGEVGRQLQLWQLQQLLEVSRAGIGTGLGFHRNLCKMAIHSIEVYYT